MVWEVVGEVVWCLLCMVWEEFLVLLKYVVIVSDHLVTVVVERWLLMGPFHLMMQYPLSFLLAPSIYPFPIPNHLSWATVIYLLR